jgi:predicted SAM-dependent methyltransferase
MFQGLHLGCNEHVLAGWINADLNPRNKDCLALDATKPFPLADESLDAIFSEHMIEHISFDDGAFMLRECWRVLKPGGRIRITTPNLPFLIRLYTGPRSKLEDEYLLWSTQHLKHKSTDEVAIFVLNNFVRAWGHLFIYDVTTLSQSLLEAGFVAIEQFDLNESNHPHLRELENVSRLPPGFLQLESCTLEGAKPLPPSLSPGVPR